LIGDETKFHTDILFILAKKYYAEQQYIYSRYLPSDATKTYTLRQHH